MSKFAWMWYICISMVGIGVNMLTHAHNPAEILQFTGGWLITSGIGIAAGEFIVIYRRGCCK